VFFRERLIIMVAFECVGVLVGALACVRDSLYYAHPTHISLTACLLYATTQFVLHNTYALE
jgi:hypothetical protein